MIVLPANSDDPKASATYRAMLTVVIVLGVLIVLAVGALIVGAVMKASGRHHADPTAIAVLPTGAKIITIQTSGDRVVLGLHTAEGDEIDIVDTESGRLVARIRQAPPDVPR